MVKIISDSTCDLSRELIEKYQIEILPLHIHLGEEEYEDGKNITPEQIFAWSDKYKTTPKTSVASITEVTDVFQKYDNQEIVCFAVSEEMSTSANVMRLAAQELEREEQIFVIDSRNLSTGIGILVIEAAIMARRGKCAKEIVMEIEKLIPTVRSSFVVDTLTYLYRGGRCSGVAALAGSALQLHPKIAVQNGKMEAEKKYRGKISKAVMNYVNDLEEDLKNAKKDRVFITHSGCEKELIEEVYQFLKKLDLFEEIIETKAGSVISSHCGPSTLGVLYMLSEKEEKK